MADTTYRGRRAVSLENDRIRVTVLVEGGHIAELCEKSSGVNPMWTPHWPSLEPSQFDSRTHASLYGSHDESKLLAGIAGHNLCVDIFGGTSPEEAKAGLTPHGEGSIVPYRIHVENGELIQSAGFPQAQLAFERRIRLHGCVAAIRETLTNLMAVDKPTAWTQHVSLGAPFVARGETEFRVSATRSKVYEADFAGDLGPYLPAAEFNWPHVPLKRGGTMDLRTYPAAERSGGFTTHLMDPSHDQAYFLAWAPSSKVLCGYVWKRSDFPWMGLWEENCARDVAPWNNREITRGMEFGVSPMPESRRQMIERGSLFGEAAFRWIPARSSVTVDYCAFVKTSDAIAQEASWSGGDGLVLR
ncbi:MAG: hypothetical protein JNK48_18265 [Bryobacterales bacterium]|nr:hypothetical protein [Bryobacterales bacterium]